MRKSLKKGFGTNIKIETEHPTAGVQKTLQKLFTGFDRLDENNPEHVCAAKLMVGIRYMFTRRNEAKNEIELPAAP